MDAKQIKARLDEVIKADVVACQEADFLATHVPFNNITYISGGSRNDVARQYSEEELYQDFVVNRQNLHQFVIIHGPNGAGKSHLIRWLKVRLETDEANFDTDQEVILFIQRSNNTLRGTISQLVDTGIISDEEQLRKYKYLLEAEEVVNEERLKALALDHLIYEIENDEAESSFRGGERKELCVFLRNDLIRENLIAPSGPIARICSFISSDNNEIERGLPRFFREDFEFVKSLLIQLRENADRKASRFADRLYTSDNGVMERLAKYLNIFVESVIRSCAKYESGDLRQIFEASRRELFKQGKNLTLFIEDITAFTGIDKDLVTILATEHGGMGQDEGICRISSFVGITTEYYADFRENFTDRVTAQIEVPQDLFGDNTSLSILAAKYLNAVYQPYSTFKSWTDRGAIYEELPIFESKEFKGWEKVSLSPNRSLTLFPFTIGALEKMYEALELKTPRNFLRKVLRAQLAEYLLDKRRFPYQDGMPRRGIGLVSWKEAPHVILLDNLDLPDAEKRRMTALICVWGNGSLYRESVNGFVTVGGLSSQVFTAFGLSDLTLVTMLPSREGFPLVPDTPAVSVRTGTVSGVGSDQGGGFKSVTGDGSGSGPVLPRISPKEKEFNEALANIERWASNGEPLRNFEKLRSMLMNYLLTAINWQSEGLSYHIAKNLLTNKMVGIEGQGFGREDGLVKLNRGTEGKLILVGLLYWYSNESSWDFPNAVTYQYHLAKWTLSVKDTVLSALKSNDPDWPIFEWACFVEYYRLLINGSLKGRETPDELAKAFLQTDQNTVLGESGHCDMWTDLSRSFHNDSTYRQNKVLLREFYNTKMGSITDDSDRYFIYYQKIVNVVAKLQTKKFIPDWDALPAATGNKNSLTLSLQLLGELRLKLERLVNKEMEKADMLTASLQTALGENWGSAEIQKAMRSARNLIDNAAGRNIPINITYRQQAEAVLREHRSYEGAYRKIKTLSGEPRDLTVLSALCQDPLRFLQELDQLCTKIEVKADEIYLEFTDKIKTVAEKQVPNLDELEENAKRGIRDIIAKLESLRGGSNAC